MTGNFVSGLKFSPSRFVNGFKLVEFGEFDALTNS